MESTNYLQLFYLSIIFYILICSSFALNNSRKSKSLNKNNEIQNSNNNVVPHSTNSILINNPNCKDTFNRLCSSTQYDTDLRVMECIQSYKIDTLIKNIDEKCQQSIWEFKVSLMKFQYLNNLLDQNCGNDDVKLIKAGCTNIEEHSKLLSCMLDKYSVIKNFKCHDLISNVGQIAFSDFHMVSGLIKHCENDVKRFSCGRMQSTNDHLTQGETLSCLQQSIEKLDPSCKDEILHFTELQSNDIKFDRQFYISCNEEIYRFCHDVKPGNGRIYKCIMQHRTDVSISDKCAGQIFKYEKLIAQDYRVTRGLVRVCKEDIRTYHCRRSVSDDKSVRLAQILLCLENVIKNGSKVNHDCQFELIEHRKLLLQDYRLSPEIVVSCSNDIEQLCEGDMDLGKAFHCLLEHSKYKRKRARTSIGCQRVLEELIKETDVGEFWQIDPVLSEVCKNFVDVACRNIQGGEARVISCLMDNIEDNRMADECRSALLQIQYFIARDYKLDAQLYHSCHADAVAYCHAKTSWHDENNMDPERGPLVLPCLYRIVYLGKNNIRLKPECVDQVHRVMRVRAVSVDLLPEIEMMCIDDLSNFCSSKTGFGEEMICLQDNLEQLQEDCKNQVSNFTQIEAANVELNPIILKQCRWVIDKYCHQKFQSDDTNEIMDCLIENKNLPEVRSQIKCRASVEHFQLITLKNYRFTRKFSNACRSSANRFCPKGKTMADIVYCLSEIILNDTLSENRFNVQKECRQQLKSQLLQQRENIMFDPKLMKACQKDIPKFCSNLQPGNAMVLECLKAKKKQLSDVCHRHIFSIELHDMTDSSTDYALMNSCRQMILTYCRNSDASYMFTCLKKHKDDPGFEPKCKSIVFQRMKEQNSDYRLNPGLRSGCKVDIKKHCQEVLNKASPDVEFEGKVIRCLQLKFIKKLLTQPCEEQISIVLRDAALNYQLMPVLRTACEDEITTICSKTDEDLGSTAVLECLKVALLRNKISKRECQVEVATLIEETKADIHVDPLLQSACSVDIINYCNDVLPGKGRRIQCLMDVISNNEHSKALHLDCESMLRQRMEMFKNADSLMPAAYSSFGDIYGHVKNSPSMRYFLVVGLTVVGMIFIIGLFCGRITRTTRLMKNK